MIIFMKKFGDVLISRQAGKEAYAAFLPTLSNLRDDEALVIDFTGINTFSPSWGDEFMTPIQNKYGERLILRHTNNPSVALTIATLEEINGSKFKLAD